MKALILALLLGVAPAQQLQFDAAIGYAPQFAGPDFFLVQFGDQIVVADELPAMEDDGTVFTIEWPCQGCKITVVVPKKDNEDTGAWKRRIKMTVDAAKELFPPDPT